MIVPNPRFVLAFVVACALLPAAPVSAGQAGGGGSDPLPPGTVTLGPVRITPSLVLTNMGVDENVFNEAVDPKRDFTFTLTPRADVVFRMRHLRLSYATVTDYVYYQKYKSERGTNTSSGARLDIDIGNLTPYFRVDGLNTKARLNDEVDARARHRNLIYATGVAFKLASRTSVQVDATQGSITYEPVDFEGFNLSQSFNGKRQTVAAGASLALTPLTTVSLTLAREQERFALSPDRDSNAWRISPMFTFSPLGLVTGSASFGYRRFQPLSPALRGYSGLVSAVTVGATIYSRHQLQAVFNRDVQYSYDLTTPYYLGTGGSLTWTWLLIGPVDVRGTGGRNYMDYRSGVGTPGNETTTRYGGGFGYRFSNRARIGINAEWSRRQSTKAAVRDYRNHRIFAGLSWGTS
jgi:hypothetical protein